MTPKKIYAVRKGRKTGLFDTWEECQKQVIGFSGAEYKSFKVLEEAKEYVNGNKVFQITNIDLDQGNPNKDLVIAYVDGSFDIKTKQYGSGVVIFWDNKKLTFSFKEAVPEFAAMRNVAGEIKAAEKAMEFAVENNANKLVIYYDYEGIEKWCTGAWKANKEGTQLYAKAYKEFSKSIEVEFVKVRAHTGDKYNEEADVLAKKALGLI